MDHRPSPSTPISTASCYGDTDPRLPSNDHRHHFSQCPSDLWELIVAHEGLQGMMVEVIDAAQNDAKAIRPRLCRLLSELSMEVYDYLAPAVNYETLLFSEPVKFELYSPTPGSSSPGTMAAPENQPAILGVRPRGRAHERSEDGPGVQFPIHRVETFVVDAALAQGIRTTESRAARHAVGFLYNCPDRTGLYFLELFKANLQVFYADSMGIAPLEVVPWDGRALRQVSDFVYSLYRPPAQHFPRDLTMSWHELHGDDIVLSIQAGPYLYPDSQVIFTQYPGKKRTGVFLAGKHHAHQAVIKDCYRALLSERHTEPEILRHIHCRGFVPGVIRLAHNEVVRFPGGHDAIISVRAPPCMKHRMVLADVGADMLKAESVNDLLMAVYDALEVHRTLANRAKVLHRDMSINNVLMYPKFAHCVNAEVMEDPPPLIDDVLSGVLREPGKRTARCLIIDFDLAAMIQESREAKEELRHRAGTGMYVAREAAVGHILFSRHPPLRMPELSEAEKELYVAAYGHERYERYRDSDNTFHGAVPEEIANGPDVWESAARCERIPYEHRLEHDAESVYWTLYSVLLRVTPQEHRDQRPSLTHNAFWRYWSILCAHEFLYRGSQECENLPQDTRVPLLDCTPDAFCAPFPQVMADVARLLFDLAQHVRVSYAAMVTPPPHGDHLHEAMQRLILKYLLSHEDCPVRLNPGVLRTFHQGHETYPNGEDDDGDFELDGYSFEESDEDVTMGLNVCANEDWQDPVRTVHSAGKGGQDLKVEDGDDGQGIVHEYLQGGYIGQADVGRVSPLLTGTWAYPYFGPEYSLAGDSSGSPE
ncbi:hypothetical protein BC628DRAFT_1418535 [Trametes gibbosa]|nr:hypothetical protein BC628DRAFT_1418535 [Trametes gibbosa]